MAEAFLPENLTALAVDTGAIVRLRNVENASQMLRAFLLYAQTGSYRTAAALASASGLLKITPESLFFRLRNSEAFLERVLSHLVGLSTVAPIGYRLLVVDATVVCGPGSKGTDWRVHVGYDALRGLPCSLRVTGPDIGEHLSLHKLEAGQLVVADRGYGTATNLHTAFEAKADFLVRATQGQIRLFDAAGVKLRWKSLVAEVPETGAVSFNFRMPVPYPGLSLANGCAPEKVMAWHDVRLIGARNKKGEVVWLITNLMQDRLSTEQAGEIYRARWQVELYFKRLKSLGDLDMQPSRDGPSARAALLAKLILLVLTSLLQDQEQAFSPYGYPIRQARTQSLEGVRLHPEKTRRRLVAKTATSQKPVHYSPLLKTQEACILR
jgi:hypothetical protein